MNFAFQNRFLYFCSIKESTSENKLLVTLNIALTPSISDENFFWLNRCNAFAKPLDPQPSLLGGPGRLSELLIDDIDSSTLEDLHRGIANDWLINTIKNFITEQHLKLISELIYSANLTKAEQSLLIQKLIHFLCAWNNSFSAIISIEKDLLIGFVQVGNSLFPRTGSGHKVPGNFYKSQLLSGSPDEWWCDSNEKHATTDAVYVATRFSVDAQTQEAKLIEEFLNKDSLLIGRTFSSLIENEPIYRNQESNSSRDNLMALIGNWLPKEVCHSDAYQFIFETVSKLEKFWNPWSLAAAKLTVGSWFTKAADHALISLKNSDDVEGINEKILLLSFSDIFPNLTNEFHTRLSELLIISAKNGKTPLLLTHFLNNFQYKDHQLKAVCTLVNTYSTTIESESSSTLREIALLYFYGITKSYFDNDLNASIFEYDTDFLDVVKKINSGTRDFQHNAIDKLKKILRLSQFNKALSILLYIHPYLNDESAQGEVIRIYARCHIVVSKDIAWEGLWIFGKALNDTELLESFALKLLDANAIEATEKIIQHMKYIEPYSECLIRLQTKLSRQKAIDSLRSEGIKFDSIQSLSGIEFEKLVQLRFERFQLKTTQTPASGDFGADLIVEDNDGTIYVIQCKRFAKKVNLKAVQEVVAAKRHYGGDYGIVITNNEFLNSAVELAKSNQIELWNGDKLLRFLSGDLSFSTLFDGMPQLTDSTRPSLED